MHEQIVGSPPRRDESPAKIQTSIERLAKFYESWHAAEPGKAYDTKAAEWRAKLDTRSTKEQPDDPDSDPNDTSKTGAEAIEDQPPQGGR